MSDSLASIATMPTVAMIASNSRIGMKSRESHALPPPPVAIVWPPPEIETPYQLKNMNTKRRIAETPAIFSPWVSLFRSIYFPPWD